MVQFHCLADFNHFLVDFQVALVDMATLLQIIVITAAYNRHSSCAIYLLHATLSTFLLQMDRMDDMLQKKFYLTGCHVEKIKLV